MLLMLLNFTLKYKLGESYNLSKYQATNAKKLLSK